VSATRTIRFERELDNDLQKIAKHHRMTVNSIVNKSVKQYVEWDRHAEEFELVEIGPALLNKLMKRQTLDEARELGRQGAKDVIIPSIEHVFVNLTYRNVIEFFRRFSKYTRRFNFEDTAEGRTHVVLIRQPMGLKWSAFYGAMLDEILEELGIRAKLTIGPETCIARFELEEIPEQDGS